MEIIDFYASDNEDHWLSKIQKSDWGAGRYIKTWKLDIMVKELF